MQNGPKAMFYDNRFDGVQVAYGKDVKLVAGYGKAAQMNGVNDAPTAKLMQKTPTMLSCPVKLTNCPWLLVITTLKM